jgi:hypothetical protein
MIYKIFTLYIEFYLKKMINIFPDKITYIILYINTM